MTINMVDSGKVGWKSNIPEPISSDKLRGFNWCSIPFLIQNGSCDPS